MAKSRLILLTVVFAGILVAYRATGAPENVDPEISHSVSVNANDALDALLKKANQYYSLWKTVDQTTKLSGLFLKGLKISIGDPVIIDHELVDGIKAQAVGLEKLKDSLSPPLDVQPLRGVAEADLNSADPSVRGNALAAIEGNVRQYEATIARWEDKNWQAEDIARDCDASKARVDELADKLNEINTSMAGAFLNAATGNSYAYLWGDVATSLYDAVGRRAGAADSLRDAYAKAVAKMKANLANYGTLRSLVSYYRLLDFLRAAKANPTPIGEMFGKAERLSNDASEAAAASQGIKPPSDATRNIRHDLAAAEERQAQVKSQVDRLMREAHQADDDAARAQQTQAILGLAAAAASLTSAASGAAAPSRAAGGTTATASPAIRTNVPLDTVDGFHFGPAIAAPTQP